MRKFKFIYIYIYITNNFLNIYILLSGIYIPMMLDQLSTDSLDAKINTIGAAIGNGCWGNTVGTCAFSSPEAQQIHGNIILMN
jgi:hypothetical protein